MKVREVIRRIEDDGWYRIKAKGGHRQYKHHIKPGRVTVPGKMNAELDKKQENREEHFEASWTGSVTRTWRALWQSTWLSSEEHRPGTVPIVLMYVLKLRRRKKDLSSVLLWRRSLDDVQANTPWQHLRPNLLLLLQLLALFVLVVVLAQPAYTRAHAIAGDLVVIVADALYRTRADRIALKSLQPAIHRARRWIDAKSGDGTRFVTYERRTPAGLENQGWKDSRAGVSYPDGRSAETPIGLIEVQGYCKGDRCIVEAIQSGQQILLFAGARGLGSQLVRWQPGAGLQTQALYPE